MHKDEIDSIFSDEFIRERSFLLWERHLHWLASLGWERAYERVSPQIEFDHAESGHEVVDLLYQFVQKTGYVNAHIGLTSSDIIDNVRLMQVRESMKVILRAIASATERINREFALDSETVGFTHWQPAAPITWRHRTRAWLSPIMTMVAMTPMVCAKKLGGPVGDQASLRLVIPPNVLDDNPFDWTPFDLEYPNNPYPLQSSDYTCEMNAVNWVAGIMAQVHKIAADLRFLASHNMVVIRNRPGHAGSSSMPHKINPYQWEKVCSIARSVSHAPQQIWTVAAHNGLERTLDGSWQIKKTLRDCFHGAAYALETMASVDAVPNLTESGNQVSFLRNKISSDRDLTRRVMAGERRWTAYQQMLRQK